MDFTFDSFLSHLSSLHLRITANLFWSLENWNNIGLSLTCHTFLLSLHVLRLCLLAPFSHWLLWHFRFSTGHLFISFRFSKFLYFSDLSSYMHTRLFKIPSLPHHFVPCFFFLPFSHWHAALTVNATLIFVESSVSNIHERILFPWHPLNIHTSMCLHYAHLCRI